MSSVEFPEQEYKDKAAFKMIVPQTTKDSRHQNNSTLVGHMDSCVQTLVPNAKTNRAVIGLSTWIQMTT